MGAIKKAVKKVAKGVGGVVKGVLGGGQEIKMPEVKTPAQQLERQTEVAPEDIMTGTEDDGSVAKGKRQLLRPVTNSLGGL